MSTKIAELVAACRDGERLLDELPPLSRDHEAVFIAVAELRVVDELLKARTDESALILAAGQPVVASARAVIREAQRRLDINAD